MLRDALANIFDFVVLEKHPLNEIAPRPNAALRRSENLRRFIWDGIERLKPDEESRHKDTPEWRYYAVLSGRYIQGDSVLEIQKRLALGERQERRLHSRALGLLENVLWDQISSGDSAPPAQGENAQDFPLRLEAISLAKIIEEATGLYAGRVPASRVALALNLPASLPLIRTDRVILRLILLDLFSRLWPLCTEGCIALDAQPVSGFIRLDVTGNTPQLAASFERDFWAQSQAAYWVERLQGKISLICEQETNRSLFHFSLEFPQAAQVTLLVVDDHEAAIRIIERYLNPTNITVIGLTDPTQVLLQARKTHPQGILLDVMMPNTDGWELIQGLKADPEVRAIPVVICSVWDQPDLAHSLGANGFLKKPISQANLLQELTRLNLLGSADG